jgi:hypothetical protein
MMWEIIYADGRANEFESNLMWRAADIACPYDGRLTSHTVSYANGTASPSWACSEMP